MVFVVENRQTTLQIFYIEGRGRFQYLRTAGERLSGFTNSCGKFGLSLVYCPCRVFDLSEVLLEVNAQGFARKWFGSRPGFSGRMAACRSFLSFISGLQHCVSAVSQTFHWPAALAGPGMA